MSLDEDGQAPGLVDQVIAGRFKILEQRASDSRRTVYAAEDVTQHTRLEVIVVHDLVTAARRVREAEKLRKIDHPRLVRLVEAGLLPDGKFFVALPHPAGTPLRRLLTGKPMPQRRTLAIMRQVLEGLDAGHAVGVIHGALSVDSIFVTPSGASSGTPGTSSGTPGTSWGTPGTSGAPGTSSGTSSGTSAIAPSGGEGDRVELAGLGIVSLAAGSPDPMYCAPEAESGSPNARSDIYAAGAIAFELLSGRPPFFGADREALKRLHAYAPLQTLAQRVPDMTFAEPLESLVATALAKHANRRFQSVKDMIAAIDRAAAVAVDGAPAQAASQPIDTRGAPGTSGTEDDIEESATEIDELTEIEDKPDDSLLLFAQEIKRQQAAAPPPPPGGITIVPEPVEQVLEPMLPVPRPIGAEHVLDDDDVGPTPAWGDRARSILDTLARKLPIPRRFIVPALAGVAVLFIVLTIVVCSGSEKTAKRPTQVAEPSIDASVQPAITEPAIDAAPAEPPVDFDARCEQLGNTCGHLEKHKKKVIDECKQEATMIVEKQCTVIALAAYACYERELCGNKDKVWVLGDLAVLAERRSKCLDERTELLTCITK